MNTHQIYKFQDHPVRVLGTPENPLFVAADVCAVMGIANNRDAIEKLDADEKADVALTDTSSNGVTQRRKVTAVTESGLYTLILRCRDAVTSGTKAHAFRKWVTAEVLPTIRRTGGYRPPGMSALDQLELMLKAAREQERRIAEVEQLAIQANSYNSSNTGFLTVRAFANVRGIRLPLSKAREVGQRASEFCRRHGIRTGRAKDELFGEVKSYPVEVLDEIYPSQPATGATR